jgi:hypothetical protein
MGVPFTTCLSHRHVSHRRAAHRRASHGRAASASWACTSWAYISRACTFWTCICFQIQKGFGKTSRSPLVSGYILLNHSWIFGTSPPLYPVSVAQRCEQEHIVPGTSTGNTRHLPFSFLDRLATNHQWPSLVSCRPLSLASSAF